MASKRMLLMGSHGSLKEQVHARVGQLPITPWTYFERIPTAASLGQLVAVRGTVTRTGACKMLERWKAWECSRCRARVLSYADDAAYGCIARPSTCTGTVDELPCRGTKFGELDERSAGRCEDYQEIKIQELTSALEVGAVPRAVHVLLRHDLVDSSRAGEDVVVVGVVGCRSRPLRNTGTRCDGELFLSAVSVAPFLDEGSRSAGSAEQSALAFERFWAEHGEGEAGAWAARDRIVSSFCPQIFGLHLVKLTVLMTVIGGSAETEGPDAGAACRGSRREGHLLLIGDPGTAKSQFLVAAARLCPRSVATTGSGSTNAGLTVAAVKDGPDWQLEAGALVMADRGLCCIDEFNGLRPQDRAAIHEAMEQQTLSVAKAGLVCTLSTRCSVIAACNARGGFDEARCITANVALASPLLSRFDLILLLLDQQKGGPWDEVLSAQILQRAMGSRGAALGAHAALWDWDVLRAYVGHVRAELHPRMTPLAAAVLSRYYQRQRGSDGREAARTTVRLLESLVRLSQAHAKLMFSRAVQLRDAVVAVQLMEASLWSNGAGALLKVDLHAAPCAEPHAAYKALEQQLLLALEINPALYALSPEDLAGDGDLMDELLRELPQTARRASPASLHSPRAPSAAWTPSQTQL